MQNRKGLDVAPTDVVIKFDMLKDSEYEPSEKSTLVMNFQKYWDFPAEPNPKRLSPFRNPLSKQFKLIGFDLTKHNDLVSFIREHMLRKGLKMYFSHPALLKSAVLDGCTDIENVAVRIPIATQKFDIVLMGDILTYQDKKVVRTEYIVKSLSLLKPSPHHGEIKVDAALVIRVRNGEQSGYFRPDKKLCEGVPHNVYANTVLTAELAEKLNSLYVVKDQYSAIDRLNEWKRFLASEKNEAELIEDGGYLIGRPEFFVAYPVDKTAEVDENEKVIRTEKHLWVDSPKEGSIPHMLVRVTHPVSIIQLEQDPKYVIEFNKMTAEEIIIVDPDRKMEECAEIMTKEDLRLSRIGKERLVPAIIDNAIGREKLQSFRTVREEKVALAESEYGDNVASLLAEEEARFRNEVLSGTVLDEYLESSPDLVEKKSAEVLDDRADRISEDMVRALAPLKEKLDAGISGDIDALDRETAESRLDSGLLPAYREYIEGRSACRTNEIKKSIPAEECIEEARGLLKQQKLNELCRAHMEPFSETVRREQAHIKSQKIGKAWTEFKEALLEGEMGSLTTYYDVEIPVNVPVGQEVSIRNNFFSKSNQFKIIIDQTGAKTNLSRQEEALESFMSGEVANPYLASYLFDTENIPLAEVEPIEFFFKPRLNSLQRKAVQGAAGNNGLYLIQGPPGTGKTEVISEIVTQMALDGHKILVTSQNNKAIDNAFERLEKFSVIRPVRMMADGKDSSFDLRGIVSNFYRNIHESADFQYRAYSNEEKLEEFRQKFKRITELYGPYCEQKKDMDDLLMDAEDVQFDMLATYNRMSHGKKKRQNADAKIEFLKKTIDSIDDFDLTTCRTRRDSILALFNYIKTDEDPRIRTRELEGKVFGHGGYCNTIISLSEDELNQQSDKLEELRENHGGFLDDIMEIYTTDDLNRIAELNRKINDYSIRNDLHISDLSLLNRFRQDIPEDLKNLRFKLEQNRALILRELEEELETLKEESVDEGDDEKLRKQMEDIEEELEDLRNNKDYIGFLKMEDILRSAIQDLYWSMGLGEKFKSLDEAYELLKSRVETVCEKSHKSEKLVKCLGKVAKYLENDGIEKEDQDNIMKSLSGYVNVVGVTCTASGMSTETINPVDEEEGRAEVVRLDLATLGVDTVIFDEVSKVPFPELLRPIMYGKNIIMVGDHKQLPPLYNVKYDPETVSPEDPVIEQEKRFKEMYTHPLFHDLFNRAPEHTRIMLKTQYRMSEQIMNAINRFYMDEGGLEMGAKPEAKLHRISIPGREKPILREDSSILFINCNGREGKQKGETSFHNYDEADTVVKFIELLERNCRFNKAGKPLENSAESAKMSLGVITPYAAQTRIIGRKAESAMARLHNIGVTEAFQQTGEEKFTVKSVDDFQGDERDIIILSLVRTGRSKFLSDFRRINVAMSRARRLLVLVGNSRTLEEQDVAIDGEVRNVYREIIDEIRRNGGYLEAEEVLEVDI